MASRLKHAREDGVTKPKDHHHHAPKNRREMTRHPQFSERKLIVATRTRVSANPNLKGPGAAETTKPRKWSGHLPYPSFSQDPF
jgi:hypothetical protein